MKAFRILNRQLLGAMVTSCCLIACTDGSDQAPFATDTLRAAADQRDFFIGTSFVEGSNDPRFADVAAREFNSLTVPLYASSTQPQPGVFNFTAADGAVALAERANMRMRGHPLIWGRLALPSYVENETDPAIVEAWMREHIRTLVARYRGRISQYDVVNEPISLLGTPDLNGTLIASNVFSRLLGPDYIRIALEEARAADPDAKLFLNDFLVMDGSAKGEAFYALVKNLVVAGVPLDGVGFQGHFQFPFVAENYRPDVEQMQREFARYEALGLSVEVTEVDVTQHPDQPFAQDRIYRDIVSACLHSSGCSGVTVWGISDAFTWIESVLNFPGGKPLPFDENFEPKPAYFSMRDVLQGR